MDQSLSERVSSLRREVAAAPGVIFFGVGGLFLDCFDQIVMSVGQMPDALVDNDSGKWGQTYHGVRCIGPSAFAGMDRNTLVVVCIRNYEAVCIQLAEFGFWNIYLVGYERGYNRLRAVRKLVHGKTPGDAKPRSIAGVWALVTGAVRGIGRQIALGLADQGANVIVHGRTRSAVEAVAEECRALGVESVSYAADLESEADLDGMLDWLAGLPNPVQILYNNAAILPQLPEPGYLTVPPDDFLRAYMINALAPIRICQAMIPIMRNNGGGRIVNVTSSVQNCPDVIPYACSKAALDKFVFDIQDSLRGSGVMVCLVCPGSVRTDMVSFVARSPVESVVPGILMPALLQGDVSGSWFNAQDYSAMAVEVAAGKARFIGDVQPQGGDYVAAGLDAKPSVLIV